VGIVIGRRRFLASCAAFAREGRSEEPIVTLKPYRWEGPYAEYRSANHARHDPGLCAEARAPWMQSGERLILRTSEVVGYPGGFLYDDHLPVSEPGGRGRGYRRIPFTWKPQASPGRLEAVCAVSGRGRFRIAMQGERDSIALELAVRNDLRQTMGTIDWAFCVVALESPSFADSARTRTWLFDGRKLRTFAELSGGPKMMLYNVAGAGGFVPEGHKTLSVSPARAEAPVVIVESPDRKHSAALGFERSYCIYGDAVGNKCFHADPYFGAALASGEEGVIRGRLYLMQGGASRVFERFRRDFTS
jgi:hypothetical protein